MINVRLSTTQLEITGHAQRPDGVPPGSNIICSAVSALTLTLIEGLIHIAGESITTLQEDGHVVIAWEELSAIGQALVDTWYIGILNIKEAYGEITIL